MIGPYLTIPFLHKRRKLHRWTPDDDAPPETLNAGPDQFICSDSTVQLNATVEGATGFLWTTSGDGTFDDDTSLTAVYTPGVGDIALGTVTLTLTTTTPPGSDSLIVTISEASTVDVGVDLETDGVDPVAITAILGGDATTGQWTTSGTGTFDDDEDLTTNYNPSVDDVDEGEVTLTFTSNDPAGPCGPASDSLILTVNPGQVNAGADDSICEGDTFQLNGSVTGATGILWLTDGDGTFDDDTALDAVYTPGTADVAAGTVTLSLTTSSPPLSDDLVLTIDEPATVDVGVDLETEGDHAVQLLAVLGGSAVSGTWTTSGTGTFDDDTALDAIYTPSEDDVDDGEVTLTFTTNDPAGACPAGVDSLVLTIAPVCFVPDLFMYWMLEEPTENVYRQDSSANGVHLQRIDDDVDGDSVEQVAGKLGFASDFTGDADDFLLYSDDVSDDVGGPDPDEISLGFEDTNPSETDWEFTWTFWFKLGHVYTGGGDVGSQAFFARFGPQLTGYARFQVVYNRGASFHGVFLRYFRQDEAFFQDIPYQLGAGDNLSDFAEDTWYFAAVRRKANSDAEFFIGDVDSMTLDSGGVIAASLHPRYATDTRVPFTVGRLAYTLDTQPMSSGSAIDELAFYKGRALTDAELECLFAEGAGRRPAGLVYWLPEVQFTADPDPQTSFPVELTMEVPGFDDAAIYYTTDGSLPTETNGILYTGPVSFSNPVKVRARGFQSTYQPSITTNEFDVTGPDTGTLAWHYPLTEQSGDFENYFGNPGLYLGSQALPDIVRVGPAYDPLVAANEWERGDSDYAAPPVDTDFQLASEFTLTGWFRLESKPSGGNNQQAILGKWAIANTEYLLFYHTPTDRLYFLITPSTGADIQLTFTTAGALSLDTWYFFMARRTGTTLAVSINDGTKDTTTMTNAPRNSNAVFEVGRFQAADYADARIRDISLWDSALSDSQVTSMYKFGPVGRVFSGLTFGNRFDNLSAGAWLAWDEGVGGIINLTNAGGTVQTGGGFDGSTDCMHLTRASSQYAYLAQVYENAQIADEFLISVRVRLDTNSNTMTILKKGGGDYAEAGVGDEEYELWYDQSADRFKFQLWEADGGSVVVTADAFGAVSTVTWYHLQVFKRGTQLGIRVNGTENTTTFSDTIAPGEVSALFIGQTGITGTEQFFDGRVDELFLWKRPFTDYEIASVHANGIPAV